MSKKILVLVLLLVFGNLKFNNFDEYSKILVSKRVFFDVLSDIKLKQNETVKKYNREEFGTAWTDLNDNEFAHNGCNTRQDILYRDLKNKKIENKQGCKKSLVEGDLNDPYSGNKLHFSKKYPKFIQIDHIVPLSYSWKMGSSNWTLRERVNFANDPNNLIAVSGSINRIKSDIPIGSWIPKNKKFICNYIWRFYLVLFKYNLKIDYLSKKRFINLSPKCFKLY